MADWLACRLAGVVGVQVAYFSGKLNKLLNGKLVRLSEPRIEPGWESGGKKFIKVISGK